MQQTTKPASIGPHHETVQPSKSVNPFGGRVDAGTMSQPGKTKGSALDI